MEAGILRAEAALDLANLNLSYTVVTAPYDGYMGRRTLEVGQYVSAGQTLSYLVRQDGKWITANYRETQITHIYIGQPVRIRVDGVPGRVFKGHVTAITYEGEAEEEMIFEKPLKSPSVFLRLELRKDKTYMLSYSADGNVFEPVDHVYPLERATWTGAKLALWACQKKRENSGGSAGFDWVKID